MTIKELFKNPEYQNRVEITTDIKNDVEKKVKKLGDNTTQGQIDQLFKDLGYDENSKDEKQEILGAVKKAMENNENLDDYFMLIKTQQMIEALANYNFEELVSVYETGKLPDIDKYNADVIADINQLPEYEEKWKNAMTDSYKANYEQREEEYFNTKAQELANADIAGLEITDEEAKASNYQATTEPNQKYNEFIKNCSAAYKAKLEPKYKNIFTDWLKKQGEKLAQFEISEAKNENRDILCIDKIMKFDGQFSKTPYQSVAQNAFSSYANNYLAKTNGSEDPKKNKKPTKIKNPFKKIKMKTKKIKENKENKENQGKWKLKLNNSAVVRLFKRSKKIKLNQIDNPIKDCGGSLVTLDLRQIRNAYEEEEYARCREIVSAFDKIKCTLGASLAKNRDGSYPHFQISDLEKYGLTNDQKLAAEQYLCPGFDGTVIDAISDADKDVPEKWDEYKRATDKIKVANAEKLYDRFEDMDKVTLDTLKADTEYAERLENGYKSLNEVDQLMEKTKGEFDIPDQLKADFERAKGLIIAGTGTDNVGKEKHAEGMELLASIKEELIKLQKQTKTTVVKDSVTEEKIQKMIDESNAKLEAKLRAEMEAKFKALQEQIVKEEEKLKAPDEIITSLYETVKHYASLEKDDYDYITYWSDASAIEKLDQQINEVLKFKTNDKKLLAKKADIIDLYQDNVDKGLKNRMPVDELSTKMEECKSNPMATYMLFQDPSVKNTVEGIIGGAYFATADSKQKEGILQVYKDSLNYETNLQTEITKDPTKVDQLYNLVQYMWPHMDEKAKQGYMKSEIGKKTLEIIGKRENIIAEMEAVKESQGSHQR